MYHRSASEERQESVSGTDAEAFTLTESDGSAASVSLAPLESSPPTLSPGIKPHKIPVGKLHPSIPSSGFLSFQQFAMSKNPYGIGYGRVIF